MRASKVLSALEHKLTWEHARPEDVWIAHFAHFAVGEGRFRLTMNGFTFKRQPPLDLDCFQPGNLISVTQVGGGAGCEIRYNENLR